MGMGGDGDLALLTFQYFLSLPVPERPSVISVSYSNVEHDYTQTQASSMCTAAQQLTAAGMTIVVRFKRSKDITAAF
jgi:tripeptidyl-peptidase-1